MNNDKELKRSDFRNMYESLELTKNGLENSLKSVNHSIERFKARSEIQPEDLVVHDHEFFLKIIRDWKHSWMNQTQNDKADFDNYFGRAFGIDANMVHSLARRIVKAMEEK